MDGMIGTLAVQVLGYEEADQTIRTAKASKIKMHFEVLEVFVVQYLQWPFRMPYLTNRIRFTDKSFFASIL